MDRKSLYVLSLLTSIMTATSVEAVDIPLFQNVSGSAGISPQAGGSGVAWIDYNNDGYQDLVSGGRLFENNGASGDFTELPPSQTGLAPGSGVAIGDFDGDGYDDILVVDYGANALFRNNDGDGTFTDVSAAAGLLNVTQQSSSAAFADLNGDGYLDLYISNTFGTIPSCGGVDSINVFYLNVASTNGSTTRAFLPTNVGLNDSGCTWAAQAVDYDKDGDLDMLVVNDVLHPGNIGVLPETELYHNELNESGTMNFVPVSDQLGLNGVVAGMGSTSADFNGDGFFDFYFTEIGSGVLALSDNGPTYNSSKLVNIVDSNNVGWGASALDANNDGLMDLYVANSWDAFNGGGGSPNSFHLNNGNANFTEMGLQVGLRSIDAGYSTAIADYDNDGDMDVAVRGVSEALNLFENITVTQNQSMRIKLVGELPNHRAIGALVSLTLSDGTQLIRQLQAGSSVGASDASQVLFGVGDKTPVSVAVTWPSGCVEQIANPNVQGVLKVEEWKCGLPNGVAGAIRTADGEAVAGALVTATDPWSPLVLHGSAVTDNLGRYSIPIEVCICDMAATKVGWSISWNFVGPGGQNWVWINGNLSPGNFTATRTSGTVSGYAIGSDGDPVANVAITGSNHSGTNWFSTKTDDTGYYEAAVPDDTYWVQGGSAAGCSIFWPEGSNFFNTLVGINFNDKKKNVICRL